MVVAIAQCLISLDNIYNAPNIVRIPYACLFFKYLKTGQGQI